MNDTSVLKLIPGLLLLLALVPAQMWAVVRWDKRRIRDYVASRGGHVSAIHWRLFGTGWLAQENTRAYAVDYFDADGAAHRATCRTAWLGGVFFTDDETLGSRRGDVETVVPARTNDERIRELKNENAALRAELERLKRSTKK